MEHSSPLAAMQPPSMMFGHCFRADAPTSYPSLSGFNQNSFNFKDLSMKKSGPDYFNMNPLHGSSPAASLAADLSQNFHIDQRFVFIVCWCGAVLRRPEQTDVWILANSMNSPQLATPRRSLFSSNILGQANSYGKQSLQTNNPYLKSHSTDTMNRRRDDHSPPPCLVARSRHGRHGDVAAAAQEACLCSDY
jgi:M-phase inducer tyrosine phosphatase